MQKHLMTCSLAAPILGKRTRVTMNMKSRCPAFDQRKRCGHGKVVIYFGSGEFLLIFIAGIEGKMPRMR